MCNVEHMNTMQQRAAGAVPPITLATRLRVAREYAHLDQGELAERTQLARNTVSRAERGTTIPNKTTVFIWAMACGVDATWLLTGETNNAPSPDGDGADSARPKGLEPLTFCSGVSRRRQRLTMAA